MKGLRGDTDRHFISMTAQPRLGTSIMFCESRRGQLLLRGHGLFLINQLRAGSSVAQVDSGSLQCRHNSSFGSDPQRLGQSELGFVLTHCVQC